MRAKLVAIVMCGVGTLGLAACGSDAKPSSSGGNAKTGVTVSSDCQARATGGMGASEKPDPVVPTPTIAGVKVYPNLTHNHVTGCVKYPQTPPVGGDHWGIWQTCAFYDKPIQTERGVHSLEHGAVWITYRPSVAAAQVAKLKPLASNPFVLITPWADESLPSPVVASAWGLQLLLPSADDPRLEQFVQAYANGPQDREPGVPCSGGYDATL